MCHTGGDEDGSDGMRLIDRDGSVEVVLDWPVEVDCELDECLDGVCMLCADVCVVC